MPFHVAGKASPLWRKVKGTSHMFGGKRQNESQARRDSPYQTRSRGTDSFPQVPCGRGLPPTGSLPPPVGMMGAQLRMRVGWGHCQTLSPPVAPGPKPWDQFLSLANSQAGRMCPVAPLTAPCPANSLLPFPSVDSGQAPWEAWVEPRSGPGKCLCLGTEAGGCTVTWPQAVPTGPFAFGQMCGCPGCSGTCRVEE